MSQSVKHTLRNKIVSRSTVSKKISALKGSLMKNLTEIHPVFETPEENNKLRELLAIYII